MELLEQEFNETYPLATRRSDYFHLTHEDGQTFSDFSTKLMRLADEADLPNLDVDHLHAFRYLQACKDKKLRDKFLNCLLYTSPSPRDRG